MQGNTTFALKLYGELGSAEGNLFFSPFGISSALAMTYAGARHDLGLAYSSVAIRKVVEAFQEAIRLKPDDAKAHCNLGVSYVLLGDKGSALEE